MRTTDRTWPGRLDPALKAPYSADSCPVVLRLHWVVRFERVTRKSDELLTRQLA